MDPYLCTRSAAAQGSTCSAMRVARALALLTPAARGLVSRAEVLALEESVLALYANVGCAPGKKARAP